MMISTAGVGKVIASWSPILFTFIQFSLVQLNWLLPKEKQYGSLKSKAASLITCFHCTCYIIMIYRYIIILSYILTHFYSNLSWSKPNRLKIKCRMSISVLKICLFQLWSKIWRNCFSCGEEFGSFLLLIGNQFDI